MTQKINSAKFIKGIRGSDMILKDGRVQVAFLGRSNVGKSSVINSLTGHRSLVKSSASPGKTQEINFFLINDSFYFVDLPGYGYAKISQKMRDKLRKMILWYVMVAPVVKRKLVLIVDAKVGLSEFDEQIITMLKEKEFDFLLVLNKSDKLKQGDLIKQVREVSEKIHAEVLPYSAKTKKGRDVLLRNILEV